MKKRHLQFIIGILISAIFIYLSFKRVQFSKLWETFKSIKYIYALPFLAITFFSMYLRAVRWKYFLLPNYKFTSKRLFSPLIVGFALNGLFPGRVGEIARPYIIYKKDKVPFTTGLATIVVERILDGVTIIILLGISLYLLPPFDPKISIIWDNTRAISGSTIILIIKSILFFVGFLSLVFLFYLRPSQKQNAGSLQQIKSNPKYKLRVYTLVLILIVISLCGIIYLSVASPFQPKEVFCFGKKYVINGETLQYLSKQTAILIGILFLGILFMMFSQTRRLFQTILTKFPILPIKFKETLNRVVENFAKGLTSLRDFKSIIWISIYSILIWFTIGISLWIMGFGFPEGFNLSLSHATATMVIICIAITIPAAPGYWGLYEYGCLFALKVLNVTQDDSIAIGFSLIIHSLQMLPIIAVGLFFAFKEQISISEFSPEKIQK